MVFDWFQRQPNDSAAPQSTSSPEPSAEVPSNDDGLTETTPPTEPETSTSSTTSAPSDAETVSAEPAEDEALVWAREAYARLKAQQAQQAAASESQSEPQPSPDPTPIQDEEPTAESAPQAEPPSEPPAQSSGLSFLEQAAAQRQQRQEEQEARAAELSSVTPDEPLSTEASAEAKPDESDEPTLGAFDDDFTWSAEVLAAQGRQADQVSLEEIDWLGRLRRGLEKTRQGFVTGLLESLGDDPLTPEVLDDLETLLLRADAGVQATDQVLDALRQRMNQEVVEPAEGIRFLKEQLRALLDEPIRTSGVELLAPERGRLNIWLMVGVNGVGKTTTLGKLANLAVRSGYTALIAAADTFRAAAVQQVQVWGERSDVPVVSNPSDNADPAAVVFDAIGAARSRGTDLLLVDTAGRLQTKHNLMEELQKVRKIIDRLAPEARVESLLVLDASQGQNGLRQAMAFASAAGLTGVVITKLDGTARGGVALAVSSEAGLPIRFIGAGEGIRDLRPFNSFEFIEALLAGR